METRYITTDLDIASGEDLQKLIDVVPSDILVHFCGEDSGTYRAVLGLNLLDTDENQAANIYCSFAETLSDPERDIWASCSRIVFNIGYEAGASPSTWRSTISRETLARITNLGGEVMVTIYKHGDTVDA